MSKGIKGVLSYLDTALPILGVLVSMALMLKIFDDSILKTGIVIMIQILPVAVLTCNLDARFLVKNAISPLCVIYTIVTAVIYAVVSEFDITGLTKGLIFCFSIPAYNLVATVFLLGTCISINDNNIDMLVGLVSKMQYMLHLLIIFMTPVLCIIYGLTWATILPVILLFILSFIITEVAHIKMLRFIVRRKFMCDEKRGKTIK